MAHDLSRLAGMKNILHVACSPRGRTAESYKLSQKIIDFVVRDTPLVTVVERRVGDGSLPHIDANYALTQHSATAEIPQEGSVAQSDLLIRELEAADVLVISTPMHNLGVPSTLKAWIDHVVRARRTFDMGPEGKVGLLQDRPVYIAIASGGVFSGERARQPDFLTEYLQTVLAQIGLHDVTFFSVEGTGSGEDKVVQSRARTDRILRAHFAP